MDKFHLATIIAIVITTSIASYLLAVGMLRSTRPDFLTGLRSGLRRLGGRFRNGFDDWIAAMLARRERQAAIFCLHHLNDREPKDIGLHRSLTTHDPGLSGRQPPAGVLGTTSASAR
jgi:hypothetical protein